MATVAISQDDLSSFHERHFSTSSTTRFSKDFLGPVEEEYYEEEEEYDDGLGYYDDGVKRTLTDEQIAIFRHSEIEALLRERRHVAEEKEHKDAYDAEEAVSLEEGEVHAHDAASGEVEDGEVEEESPASRTSTPISISSKPEQRMTKKEKKIQNAKDRGFFKQHVKPDLRKRTWDKVDTGLGSLDYDDDEGGSKSAATKPAQRRRISYDD
ncbi:hypothetical protein VTL71DRAFT_5318 [Oculimacula yallundae]|uniref:Uncharacterized protein n=1 Tax=Oculimacula yallundae TaxID=86028 RepID=A0ABR4C0R1_9HELO